LFFLFYVNISASFIENADILKKNMNNLFFKHYTIGL